MIVGELRHGQLMILDRLRETVRLAEGLSKKGELSDEARRRALGMVRQMDEEGFGNCTNQYECEAVCPKEIKADFIADLNRDFAKASVADSLQG